MADSLVPHRRHALTGAAYAVIAAVAFSGKAIFVKLAYRYSVDAVTLLTLRMVFSVPFFLAIAVRSGNNAHATGLTRRDWAAVMALGLLGYYLGSLLDFWGLLYISVGLERLILFLYPTLVLMLTALLLRRRVTRREVAALALSYAGIVLVFMHNVSFSQNGLALGVGLVFASTLCYAVYLIGSHATIVRIGAVRFTAYSMTMATSYVVLHFIITHGAEGIFNILHLPTQVYFLSIAMALVSTVMPAFLISAALHSLGAAKTAIVGAAGPVSTLALGAIFLSEPVSALQLIGTALVICGVLWVSLHKTVR